MVREIIPSYLPVVRVTFTRKDSDEKKYLFRPYQAIPTDELKERPEDIGSLLELGRRHFFGWSDVEQDYAAAYPYLKKAGDKGAQDALTLLAGYYMLDEISYRATDPKKAVIMLEAAAENGAWDAMEKLSAIYRTGADGVPADHEKAFDWGENAERMVRIYWQFYTQPDFVDFTPLLQTFLRGHTRITLMLSAYCANGIGTKRDLDRAAYWLDVGESFACNVLGVKEVPAFQERRRELNERVKKDEQRAKSKK